MTTVAHALSAGLIAVTAGRVAPSETLYIMSALVAAAIVDADHLYPVIKDWRYYRENGFRGNLHAARSPLHELPGLIVAGVLSSMAWLYDPKLAFVVFAAFAIHLAQDFVLGQSIPFNPVDHTPVRMFRASFRHKAVIDVLVIAISGVLWIQFLNGHL